MKFAPMSKTSLTNKQKQEHAYLLYTRDGITLQKALAKRVGVTEKTIGAWIRDNGWERRRQNMLLTREEQMQNLLIELQELNEYIKTKPEGMRFADSKQGDVRRKLIRDIKDLETKASLPEIIETSKRFIRWLTPIDFEMAKRITELFDQFIKDSLR